MVDVHGRKQERKKEYRKKYSVMKGRQIPVARGTKFYKKENGIGIYHNARLDLWYFIKDIGDRYVVEETNSPECCKD